MSEPPTCKNCGNQYAETSACMRCRHYDKRTKWMVGE